MDRVLILETELADRAVYVSRCGSPDERIVRMCTACGRGAGVSFVNDSEEVVEGASGEGASVYFIGQGQELWTY